MLSLLNILCDLIYDVNYCARAAKLRYVSVIIITQFIRCRNAAEVFK